MKKNEGTRKAKRRRATIEQVDALSQSCIDLQRQVEDSNKRIAAYESTHQNSCAEIEALRAKERGRETLSATVETEAERLRGEVDRTIFDRKCNALCDEMRLLFEQRPLRVARLLEIANEVSASELNKPVRCFGSRCMSLSMRELAELLALADH